MKPTLALIASAILLTLTLFFALALALPRPTEYQDAMTAANSLYQTGEYAAAARIYEQIAAGGPADSVVYYNLGNAYYQQGDAAGALVSYEKAVQLAPRDADIRANLEASRALAGSLPAAATQPIAAPVLVSMLNAAGGRFSLNELALLALFSWLAVGFLLLAARLLRSRRLKVAARAGLVVAVLFFLVSAATLSSRLYSDSQLPEAPGIQAGLALEENS